MSHVAYHMSHVFMSNAYVDPWDMLKIFCFHVYQWLTGNTVPDRYPIFFTCPTTRSIKIVRPTGIEFSKSSDHYPAGQCNGLSLCHTNFIGTRHFHMRPKIVTDLLCGRVSRKTSLDLPLSGSIYWAFLQVQLRRRDSFLPREEQ